MPRDLSDVLHYFLPGIEGEAPVRPAAADEVTPSGPDDPAPTTWRIVAIAVGDRDVVRAAFAWNLGVEIARLGAGSVLLTPRADGAESLWPAGEGVGPLGADVVGCDARDPESLAAVARELAARRSAGSPRGGEGLLLVRIPPVWLAEAGRLGELLRWTLLFSSGEARDLLETYALAKRVWQAHPASRVGVTLHGVRRRGEAERAFDQLARTALSHLGRAPTSYGMLVDDLHVYRAIVARRPIGLEHPQSPAARALRDVARLLIEDARKPQDG